jgi:hypothetical protein
MTTIRTADGFSYTLTDRDRDYLVVSAKHEGEADPADIFWTYAQRLSLPQFRRWKLGDVVKFHSQPVNPRWRRDGEFCKPGGRYHGDDRYCRESQLRVRDSNFRDVQNGWEAYRSKQPEVVQRLIDWEAGLIPNSVTRAVDFAAQNVAQGYVSRNPGSQIIYRKSNWFVGYPASLRWPDNFVTIEGSAFNRWHDTALGSYALHFSIAGAVVGGLIAWDVHRRGK